MRLPARLGIAALAVAALAGTALVVVAPTAATAAPAPDLCTMNTIRGAVPEAFPVDACVDGSSVFLRNQFEWPLAIETTGTGTPSVIRGSLALPSVVTRQIHPSATLLMPGDTVEVPLLAGSATVSLASTQELEAADTLYGVAREIADLVPGVSDVADIADLIDAVSQAYSTYEVCLGGKNAVGQLGCYTDFARAVVNAWTPFEVKFKISNSSKVLGELLGLADVLRFVYSAGTMTDQLLKGTDTIDQSAVAAAPQTVVVDGTADIFAAGRSSPPDLDGGGGTLPTFVGLHDVAALTFQADGQWSCGDVSGGADGGLGGVTTDIQSLGGISGLVDSSNTIFPLLGVFLGDSPTSIAPVRLDFSPNGLGHDFTSLAPALGQTFIVGDGRTSGGARQVFTVPAGATRLYLGMADASTFHGQPGTYADNYGQLTVTVTPASPAPMSPSHTPTQPAAHLPPSITGVSTYTSGVLVYVRVAYADGSDKATGFGFEGIDGSGWAKETHPFSSPSYGQVSPGQVTYPFNQDCGTNQQIQTDVAFWIYDSTGATSSHVDVHLTCQSGAAS